jgi:probable rRNA maturation factor
LISKRKEMINIIRNRFRIDLEGIAPVLEKLSRRLSLRGDCSIKLVNSREARALNKKFRHRDYVPDVLSFPLNLSQGGERYLGDIAICPEVARRQAAEAGHSLKHELLLLMIHGLLHLKGLDHEEDGGEMLNLQERLFRKLRADLP